MQDEEPDQEDRWESIVEDPCEHKWLRVTPKGIRCYLCDRDMGRVLYDYFRRD